jgi:hypothetical protein
MDVSWRLLEYPNRTGSAYFYREPVNLARGIQRAAI